MIHKRTGSVLVMGAALAGVLGLSAGSAVAATSARGDASSFKGSYTISPHQTITSP